MKNTHEQLCPFLITLSTATFCLHLTLCVYILSRVRLFATPWTVACQAPLHGILQARILNGLPFPTPGDLPDPGIEPMCLVSPELAGRFFTIAPPGKLKI